MEAWEHPLIKKGMPEQLAKRRARIAAGEKPLGWKVGLGAPALMQKVGIAAPIVGFLMQSAQIKSGGTVSLKGYVRPVAEPEIAVRMAATPMPGASADEVRAAIREIMPAIEIADMDPVPTPHNLDVILEDDVFQRHVIIGETTRAGGSIEGLTSRVTRRGALINTTTDPQALTGKVVDIVARLPSPPMARCCRPATLSSPVRSRRRRCWRPTIRPSSTRSIRSATCALHSRTTEGS
jgi:hypothetical protein